MGPTYKLAVYNPRGDGTVHIDKLLTQISVGYPNGGFIGPIFYPAVNVLKQTDKYRIFGREAWGVDPGTDVRAPGTQAVEIPGLAVSTDNYFATEHALQIPVTDEERENADGLQPDVDGTNLVTQKILLGRELAMHTQLTTAANYPAAHTTTLSGGAQWNFANYATSSPIQDVKTGIRQLHSVLFVAPTVAAFPYQVMSQLEDHPNFIARIQYTNGGAVTADIMKTLFGFGGQIIVPGVGFNSANPGQAASIGYLWGKDVLLAYVPDNPGLKTPAFAYEFVWNYPGSGPMETTRWREEPRKSDLIRVGRRYDTKFVAVDANGKSIAGYLIKAAVA